MRAEFGMNSTITNPAGEALDYTFLSGRAEAQVPNWLVILGHGVTGNKDRPVIVETAAALHREGFDTLRFSFAGNGNSAGDFRDATISKEVDDLQAVIDAAAASYPKIAYIGHSMGAAVGVLQAARDARLRALVSLAGMVETGTFAQTEFGEETPDQGYMWGEETCPLSSVFMDDLCHRIGSVAARVPAVSCPWLLLHGTADDVVLPADSEGVKACRGEAVDLVLIEGADHSFSEDPHTRALAQTVPDWLRRCAQTEA
jgi:alpha/beta superfamily hydrolase